MYRIRGFQRFLGGDLNSKSECHESNIDIVAAALPVAGILSGHLLAAQPVPDNQPPTGRTLPIELTLSSPEIIMSLAILLIRFIVMTFVLIWLDLPTSQVTQS